MSFSQYDRLPLAAYVIDLTSYEVLYINDVGKDLLGDIVGQRCFSALGGGDMRCNGCTDEKSLKEKGFNCAKTRFLSAKDKYVDIYESLITTLEGKYARLCLVVDVTEQEKIRQQKLNQEEKKKEMQNLIDIQSGFIRSAKSMMTASTTEGKLIFANSAMTKTLGFTDEEIMGKSLTDFHTPDIAREFKEKYIPASIKEGIWRGDSEILKKDSSSLPVRIMIFPIFDEKGKIIASAAIMEDITKIQKLETMYRYHTAIMDSSSDYIGMSDLNGDTIYHNKGAYKMLGYQPYETAEWSRVEHHPDWYLKVIKEEGIPTAIKEGSWTHRGEIIDRHGKLVPVEQTIFPVFDDEGNMLGLATIIRDISDTLRREKRLENAQNILRAIIDTAPSAIFWKDKNSKYLGANIKFCKNINMDNPYEIEGKTDYDLHSKRVADAFVKADKQMLKTGKETIHKEEKVKLKGEERFVSASKVIIKDKDNNPQAILGMYDDITDLKQNEIKLENAIKDAREASRAKSDFLSRMSHEIRTPMNAIIGMTKIGQTASDVDRMRYCFEKIDGASKHLLGLINDILDMSKIEANKLELAEESFNFEKMLEKICNVVGVKAEEKNQVLKVDIDKDIPCEIIADEMRISQVVINLLSNAIKFTPEKGRINLKVALQNMQPDGRLRIAVSVTDTGIGLSDEQKAKLFKSFEQAEAGISRKYGGTGLGLAISKKIVEIMGGSFNVESKQGEGSTFSFDILVKKNKGVKQVSYSPSCYQNLRILAVDDDPEILDYFKRIMEQSKIPCDYASNGDDAIRLVASGIKENKPYNLLFVDYLMEDMDGIEVTKKIKSLSNGSVGVIMVSHTEWTQIEDRARLAGVDKFISKPLFQSPILDCINQLIIRIDENDKSAFDGSRLVEVENIEGIFKGKRILLAEDIKINREIVMSLLEDTGLEIDCAENGVEAINKFINCDQYKLILMDIQMPEMDGLEATRRIKALNTDRSNKIPIIAMTANAFAEDIEACKKAGMIDHIGKPIDIDILISKLKAYLK